MTRLRIDDLAQQAKSIATAMEDVQQDSGSGNHAGSMHRGLPEQLRRDLLELRSQMMELGLYDPVLVRFDSATVAQASNGEIASQLQAIANGLSGQVDPA